MLDGIVSCILAFVCVGFILYCQWSRGGPRFMEEFKNSKGPLHDFFYGPGNHT